MRFFSLSTLTLLLVNESFAQNVDDYEYGGGDYGGDYQDYTEYADYGAQEDSLYRDYAEKKHGKNDAAGGGGGSGPGFGKLVLTGITSWILGAKFHSSRATKKLKSKHQKEQKQLYSQYYNDVYKLSEQNSVLERQAEELKDLVRSTEAAAELEALQRDYDEFKQPDIDGDDRISRAEFNMYVKDYLSNYPGLSEKDYPKFDDFDHDGDGFVSFQEYSQQMALQAQQAELEELYSTGGSGSSDKAQALKDMYQSTTGGRY